MDYLKSKDRKKTRLILEIRYQPLVAAFDRRGQILQKIHPKFKDKMENWNVENVQVTMSDSQEKPEKLIQISHMRSLIVYEDPSTIEEFINDSAKFCKSFYEVFPELDSVSRIGFRTISIFEASKYQKYEDVLTAISVEYLPERLSERIPFTDTRITLRNDTYQINIGPFKEDEDWAKTMFTNQEKNIPKFGIGLDIDSFAHETQIKNEKALISTVSTVQELNFSLELALMKNLL